MATYQYEAMNAQGKAVTGSIVASDETNAAGRLTEAGLITLSLVTQKEKDEKKTRRRKKVKVADLALFSRQLGAMLGAGIPITQSIATLSRQTENVLLGESLADIASSVESGLGLTQSFDRHPKIFNKLYVAMIGAGEIGGILETVLDRLSTLLQKEKQLNDNIKAATAYPKMIGAFAIVMFLVMIVVLVPIFEGFIPKGTPIPSMTQMTFDLSHSVREKWYFWILGAGIITFSIVSFIKSSVGHRLWENKKMRMPLFGQIIHKSVIARFSRTLATLLQGGIPVVQALQSAAPTAGSDLISEAVKYAISEIEGGKGVAEPLASSGLFPPMVINMISIGEEAGTMPDLLDRIAEFYEEDVATATKSLGSIIEPIMLMFIGVIVGGMLLSLYLPIFTAVTSAG